MLNQLDLAAQPILHIRSKICCMFLRAPGDLSLLRISKLAKEQRLPVRFPVHSDRLDDFFV